MKAPAQKPKQKETWAEANQAWIKWWRKHRDSGCVEDGSGKARYNIRPREAFAVLKYQAEFHGDMGMPWEIVKLNGQYLAEFTAEDFENWAVAQKEFEDAGGNSQVSQEEARIVLYKLRHHYPI